MFYKNFTVTNLEEKNILGFISFSLATAKHTNFTLIRFVFSNDSTENLLKQFFTKLKQLKRAGKLECYIDFKALTSGTTEAVYMLNKYPALEREALKNDENAIFVKI